MTHKPEHRVENLVKRMNRIEGQVNGIRKMIVEEKPFDEVIIQLNATKAALQRVSQILLEAQTDHSFMNALENPEAAPEELEKLRKAMNQYSKLL